MAGFDLAIGAKLALAVWAVLEALGVVAGILFFAFVFGRVARSHDSLRRRISERRP